MKIGSVPYKMKMRNAKLYMGMMELDEHSCSVLAKAKPSTSSAVPHSTEEPEAEASEDDASSSEDTNTCPDQPQSLALSLTRSHHNRLW